TLTPNPVMDLDILSRK
ncbi:hypothetical protein CICLE_v100040451mg, partial [Citrus x clementina]